MQENQDGIGETFTTNHDPLIQPTEAKVVDLRGAVSPPFLDQQG